MATLDTTYNSQKIIDGLEVTPPVTVTYNGRAIATLNDGDTKTLNCNGKYMDSNVVVGGKTLNCSNKLMSGNVVIEVKGGGMPSKGQIITIDLGNGNKQYRVLKINGTVAEVLAMYEYSTSCAFDNNRSPNNTYSGKNIDTTLNTTFYNTLSTVAKAAIVDKNIVQYQYSFNLSVYNAQTHSSYADYSTKSVKQLVGSRHVYAIDVEDIEKYFGGTDSTQGTFGKADIWTMFYNQSTRPSNYYYPLLRSARASNAGSAFSVSINDGYVVSRGVEYSGTARPAFQIDLTKIAWTPSN